MATVDPAEVRDALSEADFPAHKDTLVDRAAAAGAREDVQRALRSLQPVEYGSVDEVLRSVHPDLGTGPSPQERSDPDERVTKPGIADRLR